MEQTVKGMESKMESFDKRIQKTEETVSSVEKSVEFVYFQYDTVIKEQKSDKVKLKLIDSKVNDVKKENEDLKEELLELKRLNSELKEEMLDMKSRNMRDNLLFTNIDEAENERNDTEDVLSDWLEKYMGITNISFERVHRLQNKPMKQGEDKKPHTIVAKFTFFKDRERVRKSGRRLKGTKFGMHEQFPKEVEQRRQPLYPLLRQARRDKKRATIVKDRLFVDGKEVFARSENGAARSSSSAARGQPSPTAGAAGGSLFGVKPRETQF